MAAWCRIAAKRRKARALFHRPRHDLIAFRAFQRRSRRRVVTVHLIADQGRRKSAARLARLADRVGKRPIHPARGNCPSQPPASARKRRRRRRRRLGKGVGSDVVVHGKNSRDFAAGKTRKTVFPTAKPSLSRTSPVYPIAKRWQTQGGKIAQNGPGGTTRLCPQKNSRWRSSHHRISQSRSNSVPQASRSARSGEISSEMSCVQNSLAVK